MSPRRSFLLLLCVCGMTLVVLNYNTSWMMQSREIMPRYYRALDLYIKYNKYYNVSDPNSPFPEEVNEFIPPINKKQLEQIREVFFAATKLLQQLGIPYFLTQGSLLGAYLYHNMVPWDEDLDVILDDKYVDTLHAAFDQDPIIVVNNVSLKLARQGAGLMKIYPVVERNFTTEFRNPYWPFLDVFPYKDNGTHLLQIQPPRHVFLKDKMFPVQWRPFEGSLQPVPCEYENVLKDMFRKTWSNPCVSRSYNHLTRKGRRRHTIPCEEIRKYYPFVNRTILSDNKHVQELVTIDNTVVEKSTFEIPVCGITDKEQNKESP